MLNVLTDAFFDTLKMIPFMIVIFLVIEIFEHKFGSGLRPLLRKSRYIGPFAGAIFGIIPQCGFSVISTILFAEGAITTGTLISVYMSTSDEAIPVILSQPDKINVLIPILVTNFIIAVVSGYITDLLLTYLRKGKNTEHQIITNSHENEGCCGSTCIDEKFSITEVLKHSFYHAFKISIYVFIITLAINIIIYFTGSHMFAKLFLKDSILQPIVLSFIGLIPNCAASVAITEIFLKGGITFGSAIAGLSSSAGLGLIVLLKEAKSKKRIFNIIFLLVLYSSIAGIILNRILPSNYLYMILH